MSAGYCYCYTDHWCDPGSLVACEHGGWLQLFIVEWIACEQRLPLLLYCSDHWCEPDSLVACEHGGWLRLLMMLLQGVSKPCSGAALLIP